MKLINKSGPFIIFALAILPIFIWLPYSKWNNVFNVYTSIGQGAALIGAVLFSINFILSARFRSIEKLFFGLNKVFVTHHLVGIYALVFLLFHPLFLFLSYLTFSPAMAVQFILPSFSDLPQLYGTLALLTIVVLLFLTLYVKLHYETWKATHQFMGMALFLGFAHVFFIPSTVSRVVPLRVYMLTFFVLGILSYIYRMLVKYFRLTSFPYKVSKITKYVNCLEITLEPLGRPIEYIPGQFVFISVSQVGIRSESHPFSITSSDKNSLSIAVKELGDYTNSLEALKIGAKIYVEGPYGRFSWQYFKNKKQIWIAGGIGITPFLGMAKDVPKDYDVDLYYLVGDKDEAVFDKEIKKIVASKNINYHSHISKVSGHLEAKNIAPEDVSDYEVFICGPNLMMSSLKKQFVDLGVKPSNIHMEQFALN